MATFSNKLVTIERHLLEQQLANPEATGTLTQLLYDVATAGKVINREVRRAGLADIMGEAGETNESGDDVKKLDLYADEAIYRICDHTGRLCCMASEEQADVIKIPEQFPKGKYVLLFDPLDGSSNIDANASIGTIFSIHERVTAGGDGTVEDCLQAGHKQVAAGYILYGSSTIMVYSAGKGVSGFTLDPSIGEFILSHDNIRISDHGKIYSINERDTNSWVPNLKSYVAWLKEADKETHRPRTARYIGSMVADFHRTLVYGGLFMYPGTVSKPEGKLRVLYEVSPLAFLVEQAGGRAIKDDGSRILDIEPTHLHERTPVFMGSKGDVDEVESFLNGSHPAVR